MPLPSASSWSPPAILHPPPAIPRPPPAIPRPPPAMLRPLAALSATSGALLALFLAMVVGLAAAAAGVVLDGRVITDAPAWLKPFKFCASVAIYSASFAWVLAHLRHRPLLSRVLGTGTAVILFLEVGLIALQAARGTTSHFNGTTPFDAAVFHTMGLAIALLWLIQIATTGVVVRQRFTDPVLAWTLRLALGLTAIGAGIGWLMTLPQPEQLAALAHLPAGAGAIIGAHTVGGPDGGPGLALVGWSRAHGDLRPAHFAGLHALQVLPLVGWLVGRVPGLPIARRIALVAVAGVSYLGLLALLVWQALRGQPLLAPDGVTLAALSAWLASTVVAGTTALVVPQAHGAGPREALR